ncbi:hypothetical protein ZYGR_0H04590 [Zygosaccharomyces rouxii]|uniref:Conserved oligomeric Golgi complex subunit 8 n=2 Tax=Zygosaccharomyces rouxii TaxID=4956 RepID=C5DS80_ZYGRC|nr:uncharacterized protein ZYRO0B14586g [Zygosaccharomyces rouxii]KAH9199830.1 Dor1-like family-domain-containing protein [Zygosaccharomyces rouxii]GAV47613.1 hypothetical protein ZYGR_0H04590 [Zygosaccharomyces rouxii]CAR26641.1 ZYRO0B14586p [Zygosaccharomyces rouxii]
MEEILDAAIDPKHLSKNERQYCLEILEQILQSDTTPYDAYFSSKPTPGSIVEDIAEASAQIVAIEKQIRRLLVENKGEVLRKVLGDSSGSKLTDIRNELDQLWELDEGAGAKEEEHKNSNESIEHDSAVKAIFDQEQNVQKGQDDQFHMALKKLKQRVSQNEAHAPGSLGELASVLENLNSITDLMELPFLARTCIRTGHYQEVVMLYTHTKSLQLKFPGSSIVKQVCDSVLDEITTTMLTGLVKLLSTNVTVNSIKKILNYLAAIPPFDDTESSLLLRVFLYMRFDFIQREIASYSLKMDPPNDSLIEMMVKRKIEVLREYAYMSSSVFTEMFTSHLEPICIKLADELKPEEDTKTIEATTTTTTTTRKDDTPIETNLLILQFVNQCVSWLLDDLSEAGLQGKLNDSVCLQLVYCSFRLHDLNQNYHKLFLNKLHESNLFTASQIKNAIQKRRELASKYS